MGRLPWATKVMKAERAEYRCEYCRVQEADSFLPFQIDHVISQKHGGNDDLENLAYSCPKCNQHKGTDLATYLESYENLVPLFNPRADHWDEHFHISEGQIIDKTSKGKATIKLLNLNHPERLIFRKLLMESGSYP